MTTIEYLQTKCLLKTGFKVKIQLESWKLVQANFMIIHHRSVLATFS